MAPQHGFGCREGHGAPVHFEQDGSACDKPLREVCRPLLREDVWVCRATLGDEAPLHPQHCDAARHVALAGEAGVHF